MRRTHLLPVALAAALALTAAACGGPSEAVDDVASLGTDAPATDGSSETGDAGDDAPDTSIDPEDAALEFARCMREHGVDLPDPQVAEGPGGGGGGVMIQIDGEFDDEEMQAAQEACQPIMEDAFGSFEEPDPEEVERMQEEMIEFAKCIRGHGIDFPDPVFDGTGRMTAGARIGAMEPGEEPSRADIDEMQEAQEACQEELGIEGRFGVAIRDEP